MLVATKFFSDLSPVKKAFGNWLPNDQMSSQCQSQPSNGKWNPVQHKYQHSNSQGEDYPPHVKSLIQKDRFFIGQNVGLDKFQNGSRGKPKSVHNSNPEPGKVTSIHSPNVNRRDGKVPIMPNQESSISQFGKFGTKRMKPSNIDQENDITPNSLSTQMFPRRAFKCSTPVSNLTHESNLMIEASQVTNKFGKNQQNLPGLFRPRSGFGRMRQKSGTRSKEDEKLFQKINLRLLDLEQDGEEAIKGIQKVKDKVVDLLEVSRTAVKKFEEMEDKKCGYACVSQKLAAVGDELILLSLTLPHFQYTTLKTEESDANSGELTGNTNLKTSTCYGNEEKDICKGMQTKSGSVKNVLVKDALENLKSVEKDVIEKKSSEIKEVNSDFISVMPILNGISSTKRNSSKAEEAQNNPMDTNLKTSLRSDQHGAQTTDKTNDDREGVFKKKIELINNKHEIYSNDSSLVNKITTVDCPTLESVSQLVSFTAISKSFNNKNSKDCKHNGEIINSRQDKLTILSPNCSTTKNVDNSGKKIRDVNKTEEKSCSETNCIDKEKYEGMMIEEMLNLRFKKLHYSLLKQNLRTTPLSSRYETPKICTIENSKKKLFSSEENGSKERPNGANAVGDTSLHNIAKHLEHMEKLDTGYEGTLTFAEGCPSMLWFHRDTFSLAKFQNDLEFRYKEEVCAGSKLELGVGSSVLAKFTFDGKFYRARVEEVILDKSDFEDCLYSVRYIDFGNSEVVSGGELKPWESELDSIQEQAVSCCLVGAPKHWSHITWAPEQLGVFRQFVDQNGGRLTVELKSKLRNPQSKDSILEPTYEAAVYYRGVSIVDCLRKHPVFLQAFVDPRSNPAVLKPSELISPELPLNPVVPSPEEPESPIPSVIMSKARSKVSDWLENRCQVKNPSFASLVSVKSFRAKLRPDSRIQFEEQSLSSRESFQVDSLSASVESFPVLSVHRVGTLKIEEEANGSFLYFMSTVDNPGKFYIHPVQKETASLDQISPEIARYTLPTPHEKLVAVETVWALRSQLDNKWYRVRVEDRTSSTVSVLYIDYGTSGGKIGLDSLRHLPETWVSQLPGLAVCCHLAGCQPSGRTWNPMSTAQLEKMVGYESENRGVSVKEELGSMGVVLIANNDTTVNEKMVECKVARWIG